MPAGSVATALGQNAPYGRETSMRVVRNLIAATALASMAAGPIAASAQTATSSSGKTYKDGTTKGASSGRRDQERGQREIPRCTKNLGTVAIVEPDNQWWRELNLGSPEAVLKVFIQQSGCFTIVNRGRAMQSRAMERALQEQGEMQGGQNIGKGQVRTADYFLQPDIVSSNKSSGGGGVGGAVGGLLGGRGGILGGVGAIAGGISVWALRSDWLEVAASSPQSPPVSVTEYRVLSATDLDAIVEHQLSWEAHVAAGRIGKGPQPAPPGSDRMQSLERILGIGRVGRW
jgi:(2Fe-2S) ferredoxin